jgi:endonuclease/exonuclease/phosphatase family metal-dependent hydrolase
MRKSHITMITYAVVFLFFIQMAGTLVESIYILDLLKTALDEKALGLVFFFSPVLLIPFRKKSPIWLVWMIFGLLLVARGVTPYLATTGRLLASGIGVGCVLLLFPVLVTAAPKGEALPRAWVWISSGLALGVGLSVMLRTVNFTIDYSLTPTGSWIGWGLGILLGFLLSQFDWKAESSPNPRPKKVTSATFGMILILILVYFVFSAPGVLARWTAGNYRFIVIIVSLLALSWVILTTRKPTWSARITPQGLLAWNLLFTIALLGTTLAHRVPFPLTPDSPPVVVGTPTLLQQIPLVLTLILFPVIFLDLQVFTRTLREAAPSPGALVPGMILGSLALVLLAFMNIFTNVWGYVEPVSPFFRNKFWLVYILITGTLTMLVLPHIRKPAHAQNEGRGHLSRGWVILLGGILLVTIVSAFRTDRVIPTGGDQSSLVVMTYNIQQATDEFGMKSYDRQLALIRQVAPDILALQECDSARISLNNNDFVRYYASKLGYYTYYGPTTISGTYGTAILSKFPLLNPRSVFSYSNQDEIGTAEVEIELDGRRFTIYDVHPAGSDTSMLVFAKTLLARSSGKSNVVALGDYNLRENEVAYQMIDEVYTNAWMEVYPSGISDDGVDMSGTKRIDHIFISPHLNVRAPVYLLAPDSATDHPAHWAEVYWGE